VAALRLTESSPDIYSGLLLKWNAKSLLSILLSF
jgi:hypothetical protein